MKTQTLRFGYFTAAILAISFGHAKAGTYNGAGQMVGSAETSRYAATRVTRWDGMTATDLGTLGVSSSIACSINNAGQVAGQASIVGNAAPHATRWDGNTQTDLGTPGRAESYAHGINDSSQVVGYGSTAGDATLKAARWNGNTATVLSTPGGTNSYAIAVNNIGQTAGCADPVGNGGARTTLRNGTTVTNLNSFLPASVTSAGWSLTQAVSINKNTSIVGTAVNFRTVAYSGSSLTMNPVPEPEGYALMLAGLGGLGFIARRRKSP